MTLLASCSIKGECSAANNKRHQELLFQIVQELKVRIQNDSPIAVVLPGGYFVQEGQHSSHLHRSFEERCRLIGNSPFAPWATEAAKVLESQHKGALLIFGVDTVGGKDPSGDQLCVAWSAQGPVGIGRKVFPTEDEGRNGYVVNAKDFGAKERIVCLGDTRILLCACYDGYGIFNKPDKTRFIREIISPDGQRVRRGDKKFRAHIRECLSQWCSLVDSVRAAAITIHHFQAVNSGGYSTNYWRRNGIATASARLHGGWVVASAHFNGRLPHQGRDVLASQHVPREHLGLGNHRPTRDAKCNGEYQVGNDEVLLRLFDFGNG